MNNQKEFVSAYVQTRKALRLEQGGAFRIDALRFAQLNHVAEPRRSGDKNRREAETFVRCR